MATQPQAISDSERTAEDLINEGSNLTEGQIDQLRTALGVEDISNEAMRTLLGSQTGKQYLQSLASKPTSGGGQGLLGDVGQFFSNVPGAANRTLSDIGQEMAQPGKVFSQLQSATSGTPAAKTTKKPKGDSQQTALQQLAQYLTQNFANAADLQVGQMGNQLASQNQGVTNVVNQELAASGATSGNPAIQAATDAYMKAYSAGEGLNSAAYQGMSNANAAYTANAGLYPIANLLTQGLGSQQYKELPASVVSALPESVQQALASFGITEQPAGTGEGTPIKTTGKPSAESSQIAQIIAGLTKPSATNANANGALGPTLTPSGNASNSAS